MRKKHALNNNGFSLVELIIVVAIMAILAGAIVPSIIRYMDRAREGRFVSDAKNILTDAQADYMDELSKDTNNYVAYKPVSLGKLHDIICEKVYVYPDDTLDFSSIQPKEDHAAFYVDPSTGSLIGCVYNDGRYTGYWLSPDSPGEWTISKNQ